MNKANTKEMIGKVIVSEESGKKFGVVGDIEFITESGELMNITLAEPTKGARETGLSANDDGKITIPFSAVKSVGDFIIISEKDIG